MDLVLTLPGGRVWTIEVKRGVAPKWRRVPSRHRRLDARQELCRLQRPGADFRSVFKPRRSVSLTSFWYYRR